jgi:hypothetical protein
MQKTQFRQSKTMSAKQLLGFFAGVVVLFLLLTSVFDLANKYVRIRGHIKDLARQQQELEEKKQLLATTNEYIETQEGKEQSLRKKYNLVKPGEGVVLITEKAQASAIHADSEESLGWWQAILRGLGIQKKEQ